MKRMRRGLGVVLGLALGCGDDGGAAPDARPPALVTQTITAPALDLLVVMDNSGSMEGTQQGFTGSFDGITDALEGLPWGMPDLHVGVVSSNAGAGGQPADGCAGDGDDGVLQDTPRRPGCAAPSDPFLALGRAADGTTTTNFEGTLREAFTCVALLGTGGCGFEQHLEAMRRALTAGKNPGFLRPDAYLAVIVVANEDDCSAKDTAIYDPTSMTLEDPLGPATSFRCFEFGVTCDGARPPREPMLLDPVGGPRECTAAGAHRDDESEYFWHPDVYADFLEGLKDDPGRVMVAGVIPDAEPVETFFRDDIISLGLACTAPFKTWALPAIRLPTFLDRFPGRSWFETVCVGDPIDTVARIGAMIAGVLARPCLTGDVVADGCTARDAAGSEVAFALVAAPERCGAYPTGLAVELAGPAATAVTVSCPGR